MAGTVLLYGNINAYSAKQFIADLNAVSGEKNVHLNGDGGEVKYGFGCLTHLAKAKNVNLFNDGEANSMLAFAFCYPAAKKVCSDFSTFGFHRAAFPSWYESDPDLFDAESQADLAKKNADLRKALEGTVDAVKWMQVTKCTIDELFSMAGRKEVLINAEQAKELGLVDEIITVTPEKRKEVSALRAQIEAKFSKEPQTAIAAEDKTTQTQTKKIMTAAEFKAAHPAEYAAIVTAERERCEAWAVFSDVDAKAASEGISSGKNISAKQQAEFLRKQISADTAKKIEEENVGETKTGASSTGAAKTEAEKVQATNMEAVRKQLNLEKK